MSASLRILVTGAGGQLGRSLRDRIARSTSPAPAACADGAVQEGAASDGRAAPGSTCTDPAVADLTFADRARLDVTRADAIEAWLDRHPADVVINAAAYTAVDRAAAERGLAMAVNAEAPGLLARACARRGARLLHVSTDYVFDGRAGRPYVEDDPPNPINTYGLSKLEGEREALRRAPDGIVLRTGWVFGAHGGNFVKTVLRLGRERGALDVADDQFGGPTWAGDLAAVLLELAMRPAAPGGIYHFGGEPWMSRHGFAREILDEALARGLLEHPPRLRAIASADWPSPEPRPADSRLDGSKLAALLGRPPPDWRIGLARTLDALARAPEGLQ